MSSLVASPSHPATLRFGALGTEPRLPTCKSSAFSVLCPSRRSCFIHRNQCNKIQLSHPLVPSVSGPPLQNLPGHPRSSPGWILELRAIRAAPRRPEGGWEIVPPEPLVPVGGPPPPSPSLSQLARPAPDKALETVKSHHFRWSLKGPGSGGGGSIKELSGLEGEFPSGLGSGDPKRSGAQWRDGEWKANAITNGIIRRFISE